jgi:hypothetical protein
MESVKITHDEQAVAEARLATLLDPGQVLLKEAIVKLKKQGWDEPAISYECKKMVIAAFEDQDEANERRQKMMQDMEDELDQRKAEETAEAVAAAARLAAFSPEELSLEYARIQQELKTEIDRLEEQRPSYNRRSHVKKTLQHALSDVVLRMEENADAAKAAVAEAVDDDDDDGTIDRKSHKKQRRQETSVETISSKTAVGTSWGDRSSSTYHPPATWGKRSKNW